MPEIRCNGINIAFDDYGDINDPVILMLMGLSLPSSAWPTEILQGLVARGYRVITPDNRDCGLSQSMDHLKTTNFRWQILRNWLGLNIDAPYQLSDMMRDQVELLNELGVDKFHLVGLSMGGMIAQLIAIHNPQRVLSLSSIMSTSARRGLPGPRKNVLRMIVRRPQNSSESARLSHAEEIWKLLSGPGHKVSEEQLRQFVRRIYDRGMNPVGTGRQLLAILAAPSRVAELGQLRMPVQVIHGDADPLVPVECGRDTAKSVPGAVIHEIKGMGHDLPQQLYPLFVELIANHAATARLGNA